MLLAPAVLLLALGAWNAYADLQMSRTSALQREIQEVRTRAARRAGRLESLVESAAGSASGPVDWTAISGDAGMQRLWAEERSPGHRPYAAVVDEAGFIVLHTDPRRVGGRLASGWYERRVPEAGPDVKLLDGGPLSGDAPAYDVSVGLMTSGRWVGDYHEGLDAQGFAAQAAAGQRAVLVRWSWILAIIALAGAGAAGGLLYLARRHQLGLWRCERLLRARTRELSQLGGGLAHEVRNPLHALRINLHTLRRSMSGRGGLSPDQLAATFQESDSAINRLDSLMRDLVQFTDPAAGQPARLEVSGEVRAAVHLLGQNLSRDEIEVHTAFPEEPSLVVIDPERLRQVLLNVLTFAQHRTGKGGQIAVEVVRADGHVNIVVTDAGPPLAAEKLDHFFEPFQAPGDTGSGLGLALVQTFAEANGGRVCLERPGPTGSRLRIWLPLAPPNPTGVAP